MQMSFQDVRQLWIRCVAVWTEDVMVVRDCPVAPISGWITACTALSKLLVHLTLSETFEHGVRCPPSTRRTPRRDILSVCIEVDSEADIGFLSKHVFR